MAAKPKNYKEALDTPLEDVRRRYTEAKMHGIRREPRPPNPNFPQYLETSTMEIWAMDGKSHKLEEVLQEIDDLGYDKGFKMRGIQELDRRLGKFKITFASNKEMRNVKIDWAERSRKGETIIVRLQAKHEDEQETNVFTLQGVPMEYPLEMTREYLRKYVEEPEVSRVKIQGRPHLFNGDLRVEHKGLKTKIDNRIWVGPGISAWVRGLTQRPMCDWRPKCSRCQELGHLAPNCTNEEKCRKCKMEGHQPQDCKWCIMCRRNGHDIQTCLHNPIGTSPKQDETTPNRERRLKQKETEREHQEKLRTLTNEYQEIPQTTRYEALLEICPDCNGPLKEDRCIACNRVERDMTFPTTTLITEASGDIRTSTPQAAEAAVNFSQHVENERRQEKEKEGKRKKKKGKKKHEEDKDKEEHQRTQKERKKGREKKERKKKRKQGRRKEIEEEEAVNRMEEEEQTMEKQRKKEETEVEKRLTEERRKAEERQEKEEMERKEKEKNNYIKRARGIREEKRLKENQKATKLEMKKLNEHAKKDEKTTQYTADTSMASKVQKLTAQFENSIAEEKSVKTKGKRHTNENSWNDRTGNESKKQNKKEAESQLPEPAPPKNPQPSNQPTTD